MMEIVIPSWLANKIKEDFGSLEEYSRQHWGGSIKFVDPYWDYAAFESMNRVNDKPKRGRRG